MNCATLQFVETTERHLRLLGLLAARSWWTGDELAERLDVTPRTVRRDMNRLRNAGYPVEAVSGPLGGYQLGAGAKLPPLVLDDEEAVAVALSLRMVAGQGAPGLETAALGALTKLDQVLPATLRVRVAALAEVTLGLVDVPLPAGETEALVTLAVAAQRAERIRFDYTSGDGTPSTRLVEPFRLVRTERQWYLVAFDPDRTAWRTFRLDRIERLRETRQRFQRVDPPDAAAQVAEGIAFSGWSARAVVRVEAPAADAARHVTPVDGVVEPESASTAILTIGGDADWIARFLARLPWPFEVLEPESVRAAVRDHAHRLLERHRAPGPPAGLPARGAG